MSQLRSLLLILNRGAIMYVKFFDCELFIDSHEIKIKEEVPDNLMENILFHQIM